MQQPPPWDLAEAHHAGYNAECNACGGAAAAAASLNQVQHRLEEPQRTKQHRQTGLQTRTCALWAGDGKIGAPT